MKSTAPSPRAPHQPEPHSPAQRRGRWPTSGRARAGAAVLPALVPGAAVLWLSFQSGGFFPKSWSALAVVAAVALAIRVLTSERALAGFSLWLVVACGALGLFGVWTLASAGWSGAPGRAHLEFNRLLAYLLVLALTGSFAWDRRRLAWALRGLAAAIAIVCVAALVTRLLPELWTVDTAGDDARLAYPLSYWNALGLMSGIGILLGLHLSASPLEHPVTRVVAAALPPVAACTLFLTLSRGGVAATVIAVAVYLVLGFSRGVPAALLAALPACAIAVMAAYDADVLVTAEAAGPAGVEQGGDVLRALAVAVPLALVIRAAGLFLDGLLGRLVERVSLSRTVVAVTALVVVLALAGGAVATGAPGWAERQVDRFLAGTPTGPPSGAARLGVIDNNGRVAHWEVALDAWRADPWRGSGAGTFQTLWNRERTYLAQVLDAHSLYLEVLGELGLVGLVLLAVALLSLLGGLAWRLRGPERTAYAAALAATTAWAVHAGVDWDWELAAVTVWVFGLAGLALSAARGRSATVQVPAGPLRLVIALGCLVLAASPALLWRSQDKLEQAVRAFQARDCPRTVDAALASLEAVRSRAEPWELLAYCNARAGEGGLALRAAEAAVARDPDNWEMHYALALIRGATGRDPRRAAARARRLNPLEPKTAAAVEAFDTDSRRAWQRRAQELPLQLD